MKACILFAILVMVSLQFYAQKGIGINTTNPEGTIDVKVLSNDDTKKTVSVKDAQKNEILTILDNGNIGVGLSNPKVRLDLRNTSRKSEIGIGYTEAKASDVGEGAIQFAPNFNQLQFSNGKDWLRFTSQLKRPYVLASNNYIAGNYPDSAITTLMGFVTNQDSYNSFNAEKAIFVAPMESVYIFSFTVAFEPGEIKAGSYIEGAWVANTGDTIKAVRYFSQGGNGMASINCYGTMRLSVGDTIRPQIYHTLGVTKELFVYKSQSVEFNYNNIFIFAL